MAGMVYPQPQVPLTGEQIVRKGITITGEPQRLLWLINVTSSGVYGYGEEDLVAAVNFLTSASLPVEELVSPVHSLSDIEQAMTLAASGRYHRVLIQP